MLDPGRRARADRRRQTHDGALCRRGGNRPDRPWPRMSCASPLGRANQLEGGRMRATAVVNRRLLLAVALVAAGALVLTALLVQRSGPPAARAADHLDAPGLMPPGGSVQSD